MQDNSVFQWLVVKLFWSFRIVFVVSGFRFGRIACFGGFVSSRFARFVSLVSFRCFGFWYMPQNTYRTRWWSSKSVWTESAHKQEQVDMPSWILQSFLKSPFRSDARTRYLDRPLGKNEIGKFLKDAFAAAKLDDTNKKITNHSVRKTSVRWLLEADVQPNFVAQLSGHKNLKSVDSYHSATLKRQREMSAILNREPTSAQSEEKSTTLQHSKMSSQSNKFIRVWIERNCRPYIVNRAPNVMTKCYFCVQIWLVSGVFCRQTGRSFLPRLLYKTP